MKTIIETTSNLSKYLLEDQVTVTLGPDQVVVGDPPLFIIGDINSITAVVYKDVTAPDDWAGNKYTFDGTDWELNPNWTDPTTTTQWDIERERLKSKV